MTSPHHIVFVTRALPHHGIGGMQSVAWDVATSLANSGIRVTVMTTEIPSKPTLFEDQNVSIRALANTNWRRYNRRWWWSTRRVFEQELLRDCDLVLSISAGGFGLLPLRPRMPHTPFVLQAHGTSMGEVVSKWRSGSPLAIATSARNVRYIPKDLKAYRSFDTIVAVGQRVLRDFSKWPYRRLFQRARVELIRNGIETTHFRPDPAIRATLRAELNCRDDTKVIISVSRLHKQKGIALGLDAFAVLRANLPDLRYLILGDGPELLPLQRHAYTLGVADHVQFLGSTPRTHVPAYLNAADVMLFTTTHVEGEPLNVLEALAVGLPVVASRHLYPLGTPSDHIIPVRPDDRHDVHAGLRRALNIPNSPRQSALPAGLSMAEATQSYLSLFTRLIDERAADRSF